MKVRDVIREVEALGWKLDHWRGDHRVFRHPTLKGNVVVPGHLGDDIASGTLSNIRKQARGQ